jgi:biotin transport system substrate-specific component
MTGDYHRSLIITHTTLFIAMTTVFSWISIPFIPVPITLQTLGVLLTGTIMKRYAGIPMALYLLLGAIGLPIFHNGAAGLGVLIGPTGGYLIGFIPAAIMVGLCYEQVSEKIHVAGLASGILIIYLFGLSCLILSVPMGIIPAITAGMLPFIPGDIIKSTAAFLITKRIQPYTTRLTTR